MSASITSADSTRIGGSNVSAQSSTQGSVVTQQVPGVWKLGAPSAGRSCPDA